MIALCTLLTRGFFSESRFLAFNTASEGSGKPAHAIRLPGTARRDER
jgi:hypothetical protein